MRSFIQQLSIYTSLIFSLFGALSSNAQEYPSKPITIIVPFSVGGGVDTVARLLGEKLKDSLGQSIIVDNKPGGSGMIGALAVVKANPDGYTLLLGSAGETAINPFVYKTKMQYSPSKDLAPISLITKIPNVLIVNAYSPFKTIGDIVTFAKNNPGKLSYSSSGVGNPQHLNGELLDELAGTEMIHVPYKGAAGQIIDVTSGNVDMTFVSYSGAKNFIESGRVRAIAFTSAKRQDFSPNVPTISEYKPLQSYELENWFGLFAPANTPEPILQKINLEVTKALRDPALVKKLREQGGQPAPMTTQQFNEFIKKESLIYARVVEKAKITAD
ncbi:Bug family tripartite tricarboxylate transporter substrate binding protein [Polynucleobacter kasalickyi]|uniref:Tripartite-type tricarboxylate transporter, receptor component TctC n=1 Tax=Polynucleobacter kasalickyi TaxID=1938817 RepID=A0A1W2AK34_9BURK|nr:tripartite tricarboxylate transporter substrate binding protein [Polynucleobacter kasalickyi]SMC61055.1 Tripartite-type tricarboxylate transporter, receptor component TctC [Polynucleobacter kasalickyi]